MAGVHITRSRRGGKMKLIVLLVIAGSLGGVLSYVAFGRSAASGEMPSAKAAEKGKQDAAAAQPEELTYVDLGAFLVNVMAQDRLRYLRAEITLAVRSAPAEPSKGGHGDGHGDGHDDAGLPPELEARVRDTIVRVLSQQSFESLRQGGPDDRLKRDILKALEQAMKDTKPVAVLFTSFVMQ
jgi:flagellar basal body-associated protein FliL